MLKLGRYPAQKIQSNHLKTRENHGKELYNVWMHFSLTCCQKCERQCSKNDLLPAIIRYSWDKKKIVFIIWPARIGVCPGWKIFGRSSWPATCCPLFSALAWEKKNRSVIVKNGVCFMEKIERNEMIQFQAHQRDFNLWKKEKGRYLQVVSQIQSTQDCRKV